MSLVFVDGFDGFDGFDVSGPAARDWFVEHLTH
jgi:transposase-like protein